ncbi:MAG TPA: hypothetical protein PLC52_01510 [Anaerolineales bacterium]|nr:hypothetical protein [Anaerolineales bacterium]HRQ91530.1 hypothetical protein [Anaerolineales bacterium]
MSDIFFTEAGEAPVPPNEVRIRELEAQPRPDGVRIQVRIDITPFQKRPNVEAIVVNEAGQTLATVSVVEAIDPIMEFVMHLRQPRTPGRYTLKARVFYADIEAQQTESPLESSSGELLNNAKEIVHEHAIDFIVTE